MLLNDFFNFVERALSGKNPQQIFADPPPEPEQDWGIAQENGRKRGPKRQRRVTESLIVHRVFGDAEVDPCPEKAALYSPSVFYPKIREQQFFGYYTGMPDRVYSKDGREGLCVEFKFYRRTPDDKSESSDRNNGYDTRNAFLQLLEYMQQEVKDKENQTCKVGAIVVFDKFHKNQPPFLSEQKTKTFFEKMTTLFNSYGFTIGLIWICEKTSSEELEVDSSKNAQFHSELYRINHNILTNPLPVIT